MRPIPRIEKMIAGVPAEDFYMAPEWKKYAFDRLRWKTSALPVTDEDILQEITVIKLHNGVNGDELEQKLADVTRDYLPIPMILSREKAFFDEHSGVLHISQPTSQPRRNRYEDMLYAAFKDEHLELDSLDINHDRQTTLRKYDDNAYDFIKKVSLHNDRLHGIDHVVMGPLDWLFKDPEVKGVIQHDHYLDYSIADIGGKRVLLLDYVYSGQAEFLVRQLLMTKHSEVPDSEKQPFHILMFGKVGSIGDDHDVGDLVFPNKIIGEDRLSGSRPKYHAFGNVFLEGEGDYILHTRSIPYQRRSVLQKAKSKGINLLEMEAFYATLEILTAQEQMDNLDIRFGYSGFISDKPLDGSPITKDINLALPISQCVRKVVEYVKRN